MRILPLLGVVLVSACATGPRVIEQSMAIDPGMSRDQVVAIMGSPENRSFHENAEALDYCTTGNVVDEPSAPADRTGSTGKGRTQAAAKAAQHVGNGKP